MNYLLSINPHGFKEFDIKSRKDEDIYLFRWTGESRINNWNNLNLAILEDEFTKENNAFADIASFKGGPFALEL